MQLANKFTQDCMNLVHGKVIYLLVLTIKSTFALSEFNIERFIWPCNTDSYR